MSHQNFVYFPPYFIFFSHSHRNPNLSVEFRPTLPLLQLLHDRTLLHRKARNEFNCCENIQRRERFYYLRLTSKSSLQRFYYLPVTGLHQQEFSHDPETENDEMVNVGFILASSVPLSKLCVFF